MKKPRRSDRTGPILALLLVLLIVGSSGAGGRAPIPDSQVCSNPFYLEAAGDIPWPGAFGFCKQPVTPADLLCRAGADPRTWHETIAHDAHPLTPGTRVVFRTRDKAPRLLYETMDAFTRLTLDMPVPVNRSTAEELMALPGVGPSLAQSIVEQRSRMNGFDNEEDLLSVYGIGTQTLKRLRPLVCIP